MATYTSKWVPLSQALAMLVATGKSEQDSKSEICHAMADRRLDVRVTTAANDPDVTPETFEDGAVSIPGHLNAAEIDWERSSPRTGWNLAPMYDWRNDPRSIALIEVPVEEVEQIWGDKLRGTDTLRPDVRPAAIPDIATARSGTTRLAVKNLPGGGGIKINAAVDAMVDAVHQGRTTYADLRTKKQKELENIYPGAGRTTLVQAREIALQRLAPIGNSDPVPTKLQQSSDKVTTNDK